MKPLILVPETGVVKEGGKILAWLRVLRLQFYPMAFIAYCLGAAVVHLTSSKIDFKIFWFGYGFLFFLELATIFSNEIFDYQTDRANKNFSPFNGGSRVLVEGQLSFREIKLGLACVLGLVIFFSYALLRSSPGSAVPLIRLLLLAGLFLALGYTIPPLKFSYRGLGELDVGLTHSFYLLLCGYGFQTGTVSHPLPWLLSLPLFFSILAANTLAGIPDRPADWAAAKKSLPVLLGSRVSTYLALGFVGLAALSGVLFWYLKMLGEASSGMILIVIPHALILLAALFKLIKSNHFDRPINGLMVLSLTFVLWFGLIPLLTLIWAQ